MLSVLGLQVAGVPFSPSLRPSGSTLQVDFVPSTIQGKILCGSSSTPKRPFSSSVRTPPFPDPSLLAAQLGGW